MKKVKVLAMVVGLMLSVIGISVSHTMDMDASRSDTCGSISVEEDCQPDHIGGVCFVETNVSAKLPGCGTTLRHSN